MEFRPDGLGEVTNDFIKSMYCGRTVLSILPSFVFLLGSAILLHRFTFGYSYRNVTLLERLLKLIFALTALTQLVKLWKNYNSALEFSCQLLYNKVFKFYANYYNDELILLKFLIMVIEPPNLKLFFCTITSFLPLVVLWSLPRVPHNLAENLMGWFRISRWTHTEIGSSVYFLQHPLRYESQQENRNPLRETRSCYVLGSVKTTAVHITKSV